MNLLAFDLGASSGKLMLGRFDGNRLSVETAHRFENGPIGLGNGLYWDFIGIYREMLSGIAKADQMTGHQIHSFGIDSYSNDFAFIDRHGALLSPMRCYRDERTARCRDRIFVKMPPKELYRKSGNQISLFSTAMQLAAMREEHDDRLLDSAHRLLFLPDLLHYYLTGNAVCEYTIASVSQLYDFGASDWNHDILECFRIPRARFAPVVQPGTKLGQAIRLCDREIAPFEVVAVCEHDTASAYLAATREDGAIISSGTWMLVGAEARNPIITEYGFAHNIANEGSMPGHHRLLSNVMGNWLMQQLQNEYRKSGHAYSFSELISLAAASAPLRWQIDVDDERFFAPGDIRSKIHACCLDRYGSAPETPGEFARCIEESLAFKCCRAVRQLERLLDRPLPVIQLVGGGAQDQLCCQLIADVSGRPVLAGPVEASALGNMLVQLVAMGELASLEEGRQLIQRCFTPISYEPNRQDGLSEAHQHYLSHYRFSL